MVQHRFRGHRSYKPTCEVCQGCRGVTKHSRKKTPKGNEFEIHAMLILVFSIRTLSGYRNLEIAKGGM